ncbi:hypothetical protein B0H17DRAFT_1126117 [Mycena rosella]|uniref:Uncharacterized protein n=1 Tax=Mycena rosella TaxID=1033263 RepID=A0AAD7GU25_MYCRO|nr:hypothetical protein B0H17DRAFT_1126117 [Mycena rosella]
MNKPFQYEEKGIIPPVPLFPSIHVQAQESRPRATSLPRLQALGDKHWESLHPVPDPPKASAVSDVFSRVLGPHLNKQQQKESVSEEDARSEASTGLKKASGKHGGCGGNTKFPKACLCFAPVNCCLNIAQKKKSQSNSKAIMKDNDPVPISHVICILNPYWPSEEDTNSDDVKEIGVGTVPGVTLFQELKNGGLAVEAKDYDEGITVKESWSVERIDRFLHHCFPGSLKYQEEKHQDLEAGVYHWVPLSAEHKKLTEFKKKDVLTGRDLVTIRTGKWRQIREQTLYFDKVWCHGWDTTPNDDEWSTKKKAQGKQVLTHKNPTVDKKHLSDSKSSVVEVAGPCKVEKQPSPGPSSRTSSSKVKVEDTTPTKSIRTTPVQRQSLGVKLELELAAIASVSLLSASPNSNSMLQADSNYLLSSSPGLDSDLSDFELVPDDSGANGPHTTALANGPTLTASNSAPFTSTSAPSAVPASSSAMPALASAMPAPAAGVNQPTVLGVAPIIPSTFAVTPHCY